MRLVLLSLVVMLTPGCSCSQRSTLSGAGDGGTDAGGDGAGAARDAATEDGAGTCARAGAWRLERRPIYGLELVAGASPRLGVTEQLQVTVGLSHGCEELAWVTVEVVNGDATDFVGLRAAAWTLPYVPDDERCKPPGLTVATTVVTVPGRTQNNFMVAAGDPDDPEGVGIRYGRADCPVDFGCPCYGAGTGDAADGEACVTDCSCQPGLSCVGWTASDGAPRWTCQRPCADTRGCDFTWICTPGVTDGASYVCRHCYEFECETAAECPAGFSCHEAACGLFCEDERGRPTSLPCACDAECPPAERCTAVSGASGSCQLWCRTDADCPQQPGLPPLFCSSSSICIPPEMWQED